MADQYGLFFNSVNGDRTYDADSFSEWLSKFFTTGVFNGDLQVTPVSGMVVNVGSGYANVNGKVRFFDTDTTITVSPASGVYPRIDTIVVRADYTNREITLEYVTGAYSGNDPQPTAPTRNASMYEIVLAQILVSAGSTEITTETITDTRANSDICGWVASTVESVPVDQIVSRMQYEFQTWFDEMKDQLDTDAAGHLQLEIEGIKSIFAYVENGETASRNYSSGEYIVYQGGLYALCEGIPSGELLEPFLISGALRLTNVGDEFRSLTYGKTGWISGSGWSNTTVTKSGREFYTQLVLSNIRGSGYPIVGLKTSGVPSQHEQAAYDAVDYFVVDDETHTMTAYSQNPDRFIGFSIIVKGV